jgi:hypothetical protein
VVEVLSRQFEKPALIVTKFEYMIYLNKLIHLSFILTMIIFLGLASKALAFDAQFAFGHSQGNVSDLNDSTADIEGKSSGIDIAISPDFESAFWIFGRVGIAEVKASEKSYLTQTVEIGIGFFYFFNLAWGRTFISDNDHLPRYNEHTFVGMEIPVYWDPDIYIEPYTKTISSLDSDYDTKLKEEGIRIIFLF